MDLLTKSHRKFLEEATSQYRTNLEGSPAEDFLRQRGLGSQDIKETVDKFRLGYVGDDSDSRHERQRGRLAIPYLRWSPEFGWSVSSIRFRCVEEHHNCKERGHPKYSSQPGDRPRLFNTPALVNTEDCVGVTEGELDAITASACGIPTVGVPGAGMWKPHFVPPFLGYKEVLVFADGDTSGTKFAEEVASTLPNARVIQSPDGYDVNSLVDERGRQYFIERVHNVAR